VSSLFEKYGGLTTVSALVHRFYEHVLDDERVSHFFENTNMERLISHQTEFVAQALGGPATTVGRALGKAHANLGISDSDYSIVGDHLEQAMVDLGVETRDVKAVLELIESLRPQIVSKAAEMKVLVVDDSRAWHVLVKDRLPQGCDVVGVTSGAEAMTTLRERTFALILLDLNMPGQTGLEFLAELKRTDIAAGVPIVVCSSMPDPVSRARALTLGASDILSKAAPVTEIRTRVAGAIAKGKRDAA
jgi:hemoglobin